MSGENSIQTEPEKKEKKKRSVGGIIVNIVVAVILVLVFIITLNIIISSVSGKGYNSMFGMAFLAVETESMSKEESGYDVEANFPGKYEGFEVGDLIFVQEVNDKTTYEKGDIITFYFRSSGETIINTHRIINILYEDDNTTPSNFVTRGDNNKREDDYAVGIEEVIGKYTGTKWNGVGHVGIFLQTPMGYWLVIGVPALLILIYCIISFVLAVTRRNKVEVADEKDRIRAQILAELRAEQGLPPIDTTPKAAPAPAAEVPDKVFDETPAVIPEPAAAPEEAQPEGDGIPVVDDDEMEASISRIKEELAANFGAVDEDETVVETVTAEKPVKAPAAPKKAPAKKTTTASTAAKKTTTAKSGSTAKKTTTAKSSTAAKPAAKKTTTTAKKSTTSSKGGLIGTGSGAKRATTTKKKSDE